MRVLVAFDKFKDAVSARTACAAAAAGLRTAQPAWELDLCPLADGGDGFAERLTAAADGSWHEQTVTSANPARRVTAGFGLVSSLSLPPAVRELLRLPGGTLGIVDVAGASGLARLSATERNPWQTTSLGTGELLQAAVAAGAEGLLLGLGGSATHDLALGALVALGWRAHGRSGRVVELPTPERWPEIEWLEPAERPLPPLRLACDVENPLLGPRGAAAVYAPQKGLRPEDGARLEAATARMAGLMLAATGQTEQREAALAAPGAGAAGGMGFGLSVAAAAAFLPGFAVVAEWLRLDERIEAADLILTGEGSFDASSLEGKGPGALVQRGLAQGKRVHVFAGRVQPGLAVPAPVTAISTEGVALPAALAATADALRTAVERAFR